MSCRLLAASIFVLISSYLFFIFHSRDTLSDSLLLVIGILSAQENFALREVARLTWLKDFLHKNSSIKSWFIIGKDSCLVPPEFRLNLYSCEEWNINLSASSHDFYTSSALNSDLRPLEPKNVFHQGFSFKVNHPVIIKHLGVLSELLVPNVTIRIALLDIQTKEIIISTEIHESKFNDTTGYIYKEVEPVLLPKHYEGMLLVEGLLHHIGDSEIHWNDNGGVISYTRIYLSPCHLDSIKYSSTKFSAGSMHFDVHDFDSLKELVKKKENITMKWHLKMKFLKKKLLEEKEKRRDIITVDVIDTYRSLPSKLLHFYKWIHKNQKFSYVMKTDDDTVVNVRSLIQNLQNVSHFSTNTFWIWSRFRKDWAVNYVGKWSDYEYRSSLYPAFPCGAAYLLSRKTISWLADNAEYLHSYQGEDVSIGIWLSALSPVFIEDENFECDSQCSITSYNRAQVAVEEIYKIWKNYETFGNLCAADMSETTK